MSYPSHASDHALHGQDHLLFSSPSPSPAGAGMFQAPHHIYLQRPHSHTPRPPPLLATPPFYHHDPRNLRGVTLAYPPPLPASSSTTTTLPREIPTPITIPSTSKSTISTSPTSPLEETGDPDASSWTAIAMQDHPDLLEFMECIRPINKAASFGRLQGAQKTATHEPPDDIVGHSTLTQLILQHLHSSSMKASCKILEEESRVKYVDYQLSTSRLLSLMQLAVKDPEQVWVNKTIPTSEDVNIWNEASDSNLVFGEYDNFDDEDIDTRPDKVVVAASLNQLVIALTSEKLCDLEFFRTFMATYQSFTSPEKFLQKLLERYHVPEKKEEQKESKPNEQNTPTKTTQKPEQNKEQNKKDKREEIQTRVGKVLLAWIQDHWEDFSQPLVKLLKSFIDNDLRLDGNITLVKSLSVVINSKLRPDETTEEIAKHHVKDVSHPSSSTIPKGIYSASMDVLDVDAEELAKQLTLIDFSIFSSIKASELLNQAWNDPKLKQRSPNILRALQHSSEISTWVSNSILKIERVRDRARVMAKFIRIAEHLVHNMKNYNGAMAVMKGLQAPAVDRLKHTKEELPMTVLNLLNELQALLSPSTSFKRYRTILSRAVPPCVPFLEVLLTDLISIEEENSDYIHGGLINFGKSRLIYRVIAQIQSYQNAPYNLQSIYQIACHLWNPLQGATTEEMQYQISVLREPRHDDNIM